MLLGLLARRRGMSRWTERSCTAELCRRGYQYVPNTCTPHAQMPLKKQTPTAGYNAHAKSELPSPTSSHHLRSPFAFRLPPPHTSPQCVLTALNNAQLSAL